MAKNITSPAPNGTILATDELTDADLDGALVKVQYAKIMDGTPGSNLKAGVTARGLKVEPSGAVASGVTDSGNPIKIGGKYNSSPITLTDGQRGDVQVDTSGRILVNPGASLYTTDSIAAVISDATNTANILKSDSTVAGYNALMVSGTGYTTGTLTLNSGSPATAWFDMLNYAWVSVEILTNTTPATLTFQTSGDALQTNISPMNLAPGVGSVSSTTTSATATYHGARIGRYFRVLSNNGAGSSTLAITFYTVASALHQPLASQGGVWTVQPGNTPNTTAWLVDASATTQPVNITKISGTTLTIGQQTAANSLPVILPSATVTSLTPPSNTGYALDASLATIDTDLKANITLHAGSNVIGKVGIDQTTPGTTNLVSIGANQSVNTTQINGVTRLTGNGTTGTGSPRVTIASDNTPIPIQASQPTTPTLTNVSASATSVNILASNTSRKQAMVFNDSTATLYLKFGTTASATSFVVQVLPGGYYELPNPTYTGNIDGIWSSATGTARVTEIT